MRWYGNLPSTWTGKLADAVEQWRELVKQQRAFDDLVSRGELDRLLDDAGLAGGQMSIVLRAHPRARILCRRMMRWIGLDPGHPKVRPALADIERRCIRCDARRECEAWLSTGPDAHDPPGFCPNAKTFDSLRRPRRCEPVNKST